MIIVRPSQSDSVGYLRNSILILLAFASAFFPRIIEAIGAPSIINFSHFVIIPVACSIVLCTSKARDRQQLIAFQEICLGIFIFLISVIASAIWNKAGILNVILSFLILAEPFIFLLALTSIAWNPQNMHTFRKWILGFALTNLLLAIGQNAMIMAGLLPVTRMTPEDNVQGVFYLSGAGNYVSSALSLLFAFYYVKAEKKAQLWLKALIGLLSFYQLAASDSKQVLLGLFGGWVLLVFSQVKNLKNTILYIVGITLTLIFFLWFVENVDIALTSSFRYWLGRGDLYGSDGEALRVKLSGIQIVLTHFESLANWLFGLGPGHSIGRLGGWSLREYQDMVTSLGATIHPASLAAWETFQASWLAKSSSLFAPMFTWAGIWGDLGIFGLVAYLYMASTVWRKIATSDFSKYLMLNAVTVGFILTQMEEPGYMLSIASLIALDWQDTQIKSHRLNNPVVLKE